MKTSQTKKLTALIIMVTSMTFFLSCKKADSYKAEQNLVHVAVVTGSVAGRVTDLNNLPVSSASVTTGSSATITDIDGQFTLKNVQLNKDAGFVKVSKPGYFTGSRTFLVNVNAVNNIKIKLIPKIVSGNFAASSGGIINIWGGGSVDIGAGSIVNVTTGAVYTGNVSVSTFYLNPADASFNEYMPGDLRGINTGNEERILQSFGMVSIEMNNASGEKLQLAPGKTATITLPVSSVMQSNAPATIPLWYFDETKGIWKEEGSANRQGNNYTGTVAHFSFWNCDLPAQYVRLDITFKDQKGNAIANKLVTIGSAAYGTRGGYTDSKGAVSGLIPANETLVIKVFGQCSEIIYTKNIGPFATDAAMGNTTVEFVTAQSSVTLSGTVANCNNIPVTDGYVQVISGDNYFHAAITNGNFTITFDHCTNSSTPVTVIAYDVANTQQSRVKTINVINNSQSIGQLTTCDNYTLPKNYIPDENVAFH